MSRGPSLKGLPADHPRLIRHYKLPSDNGVIAEDQRWRDKAERGSARLLSAIQAVMGRKAGQ